MEFSPSGFLPEHGSFALRGDQRLGYGWREAGRYLFRRRNRGVVASLRDDLGLEQFDPRGMPFTDRGDLLISGSSATCRR